MEIRKLPVVLGLVAAALSLSGCGGASNSDKNVLNRYSPSQLKGLDPMLASTTYSHRAVANMYEGLLQYKYLARPYAVEPNLATEMPTISADGLTYTFKLHKGVFFHDDKCFPGGKGRELTAEDFIYSWKRIADMKNLSEGWWIFDERIQGLNEFREYTKSADKVDYKKPVSGLTAKDKYTLEVKLTKPYPQLLYILTMGYTMAVPHEAVEHYGKEFLNHPVGTGPYKLKKWVKGSKVVFVRNEKWRGQTYPTEGEAADKKLGLLDDAGKKIPFLDEVVTHIMVEDQPRWLKFMRGDIDYMAPPKDNYDNVMQGGKLAPSEVAKGIRNVRLASMDLVYTAFNMEDPLIGNLDPANPDHADAIKVRKEKFPMMTNEKARMVRRALSLGYDRKKMIQLLYTGRALPAKGPIPPGLEGYDPEMKNPWVEYDIEAAKKLLADAGFPEGKGLPPLEFEMSQGSTSAQFGQFRKSQYAKIGVNLNLNGNTWPALNKKVKTRQAQIFGMAWLGDYPDAQNFLQLFYGPNKSPGPNGTNVQNKEFDALYDKILSMQPSPERTAIYQKMAKIITDETPMSFEAHRLIDTLVHGWLRNYKPHDPGQGFFKYYRVDMAKRKELKPKLR